MSTKETISYLRQDYTLRTFVFSALSSIATVAFLIYNFFMGILLDSVWNLSISVYYLLLLLLKSTVLLCERKWIKCDEDSLYKKRVKLFRLICRILILVDISLTVPVFLMVMLQRNADIGMIPAIAVAAYTTYKVTLAIINYAKTRKENHLSLRLLKIISLKDAIVAVLTLQNTLVTVFGEGEDMLLLTSCTSGGIMIFMVCLTCLFLRRGARLE